MVDSVSVRFRNARVDKMPSNIRIQWNAGTAREPPDVGLALTAL